MRYSVFIVFSLLILFIISSFFAANDEGKRDFFYSTYQIQPEMRAEGGHLYRYFYIPVKKPFRTASLWYNRVREDYVLNDSGNHELAEVIVSEYYYPLFFMPGPAVIATKRYEYKNNELNLVSENSRYLNLSK